MSWTVLGVLAGLSIGLACASIAGARRTDAAVPRFAAISHLPDAVVLANDPAFDEAAQAKVAGFPEVTAVYPFMVPFLLEIDGPASVLGPLLPTAAATLQAAVSPYVEGRPPDPTKPDEIAINEQARDALVLHVGWALQFRQAPPSADFPFPAPPG